MIIDLSVSLSGDTPVYPGDPHVSVEPASRLEEQGYADHMVCFGTHNGTHIDAPAHMLDGGATLGHIPLETFVGRGRLVEGFSVAAIEAAKVEAGDIVLFDTGSSQRFDQPDYFTDFPAMGPEVAACLVDKGVKLVGLDTCSADNQDGFPIHKALLGAGIPIVETMANMPALKGKAFDIYALPIKLNLDGAPARVVAVTRDA